MANKRRGASAPLFVYSIRRLEEGQLILRYIGQSFAPYRRFKAHERGEGSPFDKGDFLVMTIEASIMDQEEANRIENLLIDKHKPYLLNKLKNYER